MPSPDLRDDGELLAATATDAEAFGLFYDRHFRPVLAYLLHRTRRPDLAADLCAETFAAALVGARGFQPERGPARAWLFGIAANKLADSVRRGRVENQARRRLGLPSRDLSDDDLERVEELVDSASGGGQLASLVADLPADQREALLARVVAERDYAQIAADLSCSEAVVRKRVSRGLSTLRARLEASER